MAQARRRGCEAVTEHEIEERGRTCGMCGKRLRRRGAVKLGRRLVHATCAINARRHVMYLAVSLADWIGDWLVDVSRSVIRKEAKT